MPRIDEAKEKRWQENVMLISKSIKTAEEDYKIACQHRLECKHVLEEYQRRLKVLCDQGPYHEETHQPGLFDEIEELQETHTSVREIKVPNKIYGILERSGITTLEQLGRIIDGLDPSYLEGLCSISGLDTDSRNRLLSQYKDYQEAIDTPESIAVTIPFVHHKAKEPLGPSQGIAQPRAIRVTTDLQDSNCSAGTIVDAVLMPSGQAMVSLPEKKAFLLEEHQFELV
jgi:hypothetical protein